MGKIFLRIPNYRLLIANLNKSSLHIRWYNTDQSDEPLIVNGTPLVIPLLNNFTEQSVKLKISQSKK